jgi:hypothetical protein
LVVSKIKKVVFKNKGMRKLKTLAYYEKYAENDDGVSIVLSRYLNWMIIDLDKISIVEIFGDEIRLVLGGTYVDVPLAIEDFEFINSYDWKGIKEYATAKALYYFNEEK